MTAPTRPPGPRGHRFFGNTVEYDTDRIAFLERCRHDYGDVFSFDPHTVVVADPALIHDILARTNSDFLAETSALSTRLDPEETAAGAELWTAARRQGWSGLNRKVAEAHTERLRAVFDHTMAATRGRDVDVLATMKEFMGRAIADYCVSRDAAGIPELVAATTEAMDPLAGSSYSLPAWWPSRRVRRFVKARDETASTMEALVRRRRSAPPAASDLLDVLVGVSPPLSDLQIERLVRSILLAAYGVPASALTWIVHELSTRPDCRERIGESAYTEAFVKEVLRLHPPTWLIGRTARRATTLGPWALEPGDQVLFSMYSLHRDERWWPEGEAFRPERWIDPRVQPQRYTYLPFGAGPRVCVGTQLGMIQLTLATGWLAQEYEVTVPAGGEGSPDFGGLLVPRGLRATFKVRGSGQHPLQAPAT
jgi:cytochrome P450